MFKANMEKRKRQNPACLHVVHGALSHPSNPTHQGLNKLTFKLSWDVWEKNVSCKTLDH
jgi:hypothetical protein